MPQKLLTGVSAQHDVEQILLTNGLETTVGVQGKRLYASFSNDTAAELILPERESILAAFALRHLDQPFLSHQFEAQAGKRESRYDFSTAELFNKLQDKIPHELAGHFVHFGRGKGTQYVCLRDNRSVAEACKKGRESIARTVLQPYEKKRKLAAYDALGSAFEMSIEGVLDQTTANRKRVTGASGFVVAIGGIGTYCIVGDRKTL